MSGLEPRPVDGRREKLHYPINAADMAHAFHSAPCRSTRARQGPEFYSYCHYDPGLDEPSASEITRSKHLAGVAEREQVYLNKPDLLQGFFYDPTEVPRVRGECAEVPDKAHHCIFFLLISPRHLVVNNTHPSLLLLEFSHTLFPSAWSLTDNPLSSVTSTSFLWGGSDNSPK